MEYEDCAPTLDGYKLILRALKEQSKPSEETLKNIKQLERYIDAQERQS